jgi:hypothetical protein
MKASMRLLALSAAVGTLLAPAGGTQAQLLITGNDEKITFDETGKTINRPPGKDTVSIIDIRDPHQTADRRQPFADEHAHRAARKPRHYARSAPGVGRQFARLG